jgi:hypothetical protein
MTKSRTNSFRCVECGQGLIERFACPGRETSYKTLSLPVPSTFEIPTCNHCGTEWIDESTAESLDSVLEVEYRTRLKAMLKSSLDKSDVAKAAIERALGLSQGYLSHITGAGDKAPSEMLAFAVVSIAQSGTSSVEALWKSLSGGRPEFMRTGAPNIAPNKAARSSSKTSVRRAPVKASEGRVAKKLSSAKRAVRS